MDPLGAQRFALCVKAVQLSRGHFFLRGTSHTHEEAVRQESLSPRFWRFPMDLGIPRLSLSESPEARDSCFEDSSQSMGDEDLRVSTWDNER